MRRRERREVRRATAAEALRHERPLRAKDLRGADAVALAVERPLVEDRERHLAVARQLREARDRVLVDRAPVDAALDALGQRDLASRQRVVEFGADETRRVAEVPARPE